MQRKNGRRKKIAYVLCGILAVVLFSGCQSTAADGTDEKVFIYGDTTFNAENDESDVNPHNGYSGWACIRYGIGETLFHYSDSMEIEPWLAESYEIVDDTTWRITLHEGISFTSGRTLDAEAVKECLEDLIAVHGHELLDAAHESKVDFLFEAAVAGGIPIIRPLKQCLAGNHMTEVMGIVNGTTNFILTKMTQEGMEFKDALALATELGYAEADPTADIEGLDAGRKVAILASVAFNSRVVFNDVYTEGIAKITSKDIHYAKEMGRDIKLLGVARNEADGIEAYVCPMLIPSSHPLATVNDSYNAVFVHGDAVEDAMFFGRGAGELPTASAVVGDVFDIVRNILAGCCGRIGCTCYKNIPVKKMEDTHNRYFLRLKVEDRCGVLAEMTAIFAKYQVSVAQIIQKDTKVEGCAEVVVITEKVREGDFRTAIEELRNRDSVRKISTIIRVYGK